MTEFTNHIKRWTGRLMSSKSASKKHTRVVNDKSEHLEKEGDDHRHGAEGNAFQVNGEPEEIIEKDDDHRHGAEGDALQVNGHPSKIDDGTDDAP